MLTLGRIIRLLCAVVTVATVSSSLRADDMASRWQTCSPCHGEAAQSVNGEIPSLAGQPTLFIAMQLYLFREERRPSSTMTSIAKQLTDSDLRAFSGYVASLPRPSPSAIEDEQRYARGVALVRLHRCEACHGIGLLGHDQAPLLVGQQETYLARALAAYKEGHRISQQAVMNEAIADVSADDIALLAYALAHWRAN
jgi:cytochrome c553